MGESGRNWRSGVQGGYDQCVYMNEISKDCIQ